ncbi:MAG: arginine--tRNA ligase, partial [Chloroflexi bacterium]|nr:arginine--tRNA ligase [Chloroflexota bacterium]
METIEEVLTARVSVTLGSLFPAKAPERVEIRPSSKPEFGDLSTPVALPLAKVLRRSPLEIAHQIAAALLGTLPRYIRQVTVTPPGFINFFVDEVVYADELCTHILSAAHRYGYADTATGVKIVLEHTNVNSNKAAHVGHLRNACLGDTVARLLRSQGYAVEVQNYIDDTGAQVADVVVGFQTLGKVYDGSIPFDYFCSQVYTEVQRAYVANPELQERRRTVLREIEQRDNDTARFAKDLSKRIVARHLETMSRVGIAYDLLTWESDILALGFWQSAFQLLTSRNLLEHPAEGELAGCWVVPFGEGAVTASEGRQRITDKVLVKSDGVVTYTGKDLAYQMWKFGILPRDFGYCVWGTQWNGATLWTTTHKASEATHQQFGHAHTVINVIDARQSYTQEVVYEMLRRLGFTEQADRSIHLSYQVVALSADAASVLSVPVERGKTTYAFSGRQGIEVKADDLLTLAAQRLEQRVDQQRHDGRSKSTDSRTAEALAAGAIRYYLLKFGLQQVIPFDFDDALRHTGDTGIYLQYAYARACNVLHRSGTAPEAHLPAALLPQDKTLALTLGRFPEVVAEAARQLTPSALARYAFELATAFNDFYEHTPSLYKEEDLPVRRFRIRLVDSFRQTLENAL